MHFQITHNQIKSKNEETCIFCRTVGTSFSGNAQIFQENFDGNGPGFSAWILIDADGLIHNSQVSEFDAGAWIREDLGGPIPNYGGADGDFAAMSSSFYTPAGTSNDWLISPLIALPAGNTFLRWNARAQQQNFADGYKVMLAPNGSNSIEDFTVELFSTDAEDVAWQTRTVDLSAYANTSFRVAFVNNSTDKFVLIVDNIKVDFVPTSSPDCVTPTTPANASTDNPYIAATVAWNGPTTGSSVSSYDVYLDQNPDPTTLVGNALGTSFTVRDLNPSTTYYWKVIPKNELGSASGCTVFSFTTMGQVYCPAGSLSTNYERITNVTFADINNDSEGTEGYEDFTTVEGNVTAGETYDFSASYTGGGYASDQVSVWIDLNHDNDFDDDGEKVLQLEPSVSPWVGSITIPSTATSGKTRMRIRLQDYSIGGTESPCGNAGFGQVEDYTLNIGTLAVSEVSKDAVKVYPNPVVDVLNVDAADKVKSVQVIDLSGKVVASHTLNAVKNQINLNKLTPGVYVVNIETEKGTQSVKIIKK